MENLVKIQNELKVPKGNFNSFGKYKYRSCEDILEAVKPLLKKYNCTLKLSDEMVLIGSKIFLKSVATIKDNSLNESAVGFAETSEHKGMSAEQTTGTASSYARKYALNGLFLIDETNQDPDSQKPIVKELTLAEKVENAKATLIVATAQNFGSLWKTLTPEMQSNSDVITFGKELKTKLKI